MLVRNVPRNVSREIGKFPREFSTPRGTSRGTSRGKSFSAVFPVEPVILSCVSYASYVPWCVAWACCNTRIHHDICILTGWRSCRSPSLDESIGKIYVSTLSNYSIRCQMRTSQENKNVATTTAAYLATRLTDLNATQTCLYLHAVVWASGVGVLHTRVMTLGLVPRAMSAGGVR